VQTPSNLESSPSVGERWLPALIALPLIKLAVHLITFRGYGIFRDELYYLACSRRLDWGYVDQPPFSIVLLKIQRTLFGESLFSVRLLPAVAGALTVLLVGLITRRMGGGRFAQVVAMTAALVAPIYLALDHFYSMNAFDLLFWALAAYLLLRIVQEERPSLWLLLGLVLGLGLQNKISVLWLGAGLAVGLVATTHRRRLLTPWPWLAGTLALVVFLPYVLWQFANDWPTLEFIANATGQKMKQVSPLQLLSSQAMMMNPITLPLWILGLVWLARKRDLRIFAWIYGVVFAILAVNGASRAGYLAPTPLLLVSAGAATAPLKIPVLPVEGYVRYAQALGTRPSTAERKELAELPQFFADMHGWQSIADTVERVWNDLTPEERSRAAVFTFNYGDAGAVEHLTADPDLRRAALSGHNNYWLWGSRGFSGDPLIVIGSTQEILSYRFHRVELAARTDCDYCMPYENDVPIWVCREPREPLEQIWPDLKHYD